MQARCARAISYTHIYNFPFPLHAAFYSNLATTTTTFDNSLRPAVSSSSSSWRSVNTRRARDAALRVRASADDAERALRGAVSLVDIATQLEKLRHPISPGQRVPDSRESAPPWSPSFIAAVFERCAQVRGEGGGVGTHLQLISDTVYGERIRPTIVNAIKRAAFRPNVTEYSRILR